MTTFKEILKDLMDNDVNHISNERVILDTIISEILANKGDKGTLESIKADTKDTIKAYKEAQLKKNHALDKIITICNNLIKLSKINALDKVDTTYNNMSLDRLKKELSALYKTLTTQKIEEVKKASIEELEGIIQNSDNEIAIKKAQLELELMQLEELEKQELETKKLDAKQNSINNFMVAFSTIKSLSDDVIEAQLLSATNEQLKVLNDFIQLFKVEA